MTRTIRAAALATLAVLLVALLPAPAAADGTIFFGYATKPEGRPARGFAFGINMAIVGFEFEYANTDKIENLNAPALKTFMFNGMVSTPTPGVQLYGTFGGGLYKEDAVTKDTTAFGTNFGGGVKIKLAGPLKLRVDYRIFALSGTPVTKAPQRFYVGANFAF